MRKSTVLFLIFSITCSSPTAWAANQIKPGLLEVNVQSELMKNIPKIPSEQLEKLRQLGLAIPQMQDGGMVTKVCISKEMAERDELPQMTNKESGCQSKNFQRSGKNYSVDIICDGANITGEGKAKGTIIRNDRFNSTYDFNGTIQGLPVSQHFDSTGRWLGADCGVVKPAIDLVPKN